MTTAGIDFQLQVVRADLVCKATDTYNNILNDSLIFENLPYGAYNGMAWLIGGAPVYKSIELGMSNHHMIFVFDLTALHEREIERSLVSVHPNPFNSYFTVEYQLNAPSRVTVELMTTTGKIIAILADGWQQDGVHKLEWQGTGNNGMMPPPGCYVLLLRINGLKYSRLLIRI